MSTLLAVDPGIRGCGVAWFHDSVLTGAAYVKSPCIVDNLANAAVAMANEVVGRINVRGVDELVVEWPRIYASRIRAGVSKEDPNDLLALAGVDAAIAMALGCVAHSVYPSDWKGQLKKDPCKARVVSRLWPHEMQAAESGAKAAGAKSHNMWDAIGIGLHHLGRFERKRVIPV